MLNSQLVFTDDGFSEGSLMYSTHMQKASINNQG